MKTGIGSDRKRNRDDIRVEPETACLFKTLPVPESEPVNFFPENQYTN